MLKIKTKKFVEEYVGPAYFGLGAMTPFAIAINPEFGLTLLAILIAPALFVLFYSLFKKIGVKNG